jgi:hypothetical protein
VHDRAAEHPEKLQELIGLWFAAAGRYDVLPLHAAQMKGQRPSPIPARSSFTYWPGTTSVDSEAAVNVRMRPFTVVAPIEIPANGAEGVLIAQGGQFCGWALFVHEGRLVYEHNYLAIERYRITSDVALGAGRQTLGLHFEVSGDFEISPQLTEMGMRRVAGHVTLYRDDEPIGAGDVARTVPFQFTLSGDGLCCGYDGETAVGDLYVPPNPFTGRIERVLVSVAGEPYRNAAKEVELAVRRDYGWDSRTDDPRTDTNEARAWAYTGAPAPEPDPDRRADDPRDRRHRNPFGLGHQRLAAAPVARHHKHSARLPDRRDRTHYRANDRDGVRLVLDPQLCLSRFGLQLVAGPRDLRRGGRAQLGPAGEPRHARLPR